MTPYYHTIVTNSTLLQSRSFFGNFSMSNSCTRECLDFSHVWPYIVLYDSITLIQIINRINIVIFIFEMYGWITVTTFETEIWTSSISFSSSCPEASVVIQSESPFSFSSFSIWMITSAWKNYFGVIIRSFQKLKMDLFYECETIMLVVLDKAQICSKSPIRK